MIAFVVKLIPANLPPPPLLMKKVLKVAGIVLGEDTGFPFGDHPRGKLALTGIELGHDLGQSLFDLLIQ